MNSRTMLGSLLVVSSLTGAARAQETRLATPAASPVQTVGTDIPILFRRDLATMGLVLLGVAAATQLDRPVAHGLQSPSLQHSEALHRASAAANTVGDPGALLFTAALYATGRVSHRPELADAGLHATEAIVVSGAVTGVLKFATGRARPRVAGLEPDERRIDTDEFRPGRGRGGFTSFPSGHTTAAFAAASAITSELRRSHPGSARLMGPLLYGGASLVGLSRMYADKHWASDVIMGAAVGTFVGRRIVGYQHAHPGNQLDRWLLPTSVAPAQGGLTLRWSIPTR